MPEKKNPEESSSSYRRRQSTKINFLGLESAGWGGGLPREGMVLENFVPPSNICFP